MTVKPPWASPQWFSIQNPLPGLKGFFQIPLVKCGVSTRIYVYVLRALKYYPSYFYSEKMVSAEYVKNKAINMEVIASHVECPGKG